LTENFSFHMPTRIVWHSPAREAIVAEVKAFGAARVLVVTDPGLVATGLPADIGAALEDEGVDVALYGDVAGNPTTDDVAAARALAAEHQVEVIIAVGGGSAIDTAKAAAMLLANGGDYAEYQWEGRPITSRSRPLVAVPTTAGTGSEVSKVAVISDTSQPFKKGVLSPLMYAHAAVIDSSVTVGLPSHLTAATGMDAFIHALEAYTGLGANPISDMLALEAMRLVVDSLERATEDGTSIDARRQMMLAAIHGGIAMDQAGLGLVHALSGGLCSHMHLHHGLANALLLPFVADFNMPAIAADRRRVLNGLFGLVDDASARDLVDAITGLVTSLGLPVGLADRRDQTADIDWDAVAEESMRMVMVRNNPRPVTFDDCRALLDAMK
jgi:alcohol dehydrogenase class IV